MTLEKLTIKSESRADVFDKKFKVLFNPNQITIVKTGWKIDSKSGVPIPSQISQL